ncbi:MAG: Tad domain-containing protein [Proteobacteria bacterium]|nr:Tad domain-containing protein [Pseudomonadota bacterium]
MNPIGQLRSQRGQIVIPALFVLPSLFLFVFLIFETAKLSREKIRHQFALDAAAFVEMTNYSDFLNRSAYVNGAFPQRIFEEGFKNTMIDRKNNTSPRSLYDIMYDDGDFPRTDQAQPLDPHPVWFIQYGGQDANAPAKNANPPDFSHACKDVPDPYCLDIISKQDAVDYWLSWDDAQDIYKLYVQIYQLLGSVEDAQYSVFQRLTSSHNFFRKSYWLNTGDNVNAAAEGSIYFSNHQFRPKPYCISEVMIYGNKPTSNAFQPYQIYAPQNPIPMPPSIQGCSPPGLFQVEAIPDADLRSMKQSSALSPYPGYAIVQHWQAPPNYFRVNFNQLMEDGRPKVHATVSLGLTGGSLWPNPTPKFQTELFP